MQNIAFHLPHIRIIGTNHCGNTRREAFKRRIKHKGVLCRGDYSEILVDIFTHQIQSEYYGGNKYVSIGAIELEHFSPQTHT